MAISPKTLKIVASHPIQYQVPLWRQLIAEGWDIGVGYYQRGGAAQPAFDADFGIEFQWDIDLLDGYAHRFFSDGVADYTLTEQLKIAPRLIFWALRDRQTPLLVTGWFTGIIWLIWLLRVLRRSPVIMLCETTPSSFTSGPKPLWRVHLLRWLLRHQTANLFIGTRNRMFFQEMGVKAERLFHAPYSIDNERFSSAANRMLPGRMELCQHHGLDPEKPVYLFCGKLIEKKRPLLLLEGYLQAGLESEAQLLYVGEGELRHRLVKRIEALGLKHVHLLGFLNQTQMPLAYVLGEVLCLISAPTETWGLVVNEALACGRPVIVSDAVGCAPDLVSPDIGWVTPLDDLPALSRTMRSAYERRMLWPSMGSHAREKIINHTFSQMVAGIQAATGYNGE